MVLGDLTHCSIGCPTLLDPYHRLTEPIVSVVVILGGHVSEVHVGRSVTLASRVDVVHSF